MGPNSIKLQTYLHVATELQTYQHVTEIAAALQAYPLHYCSLI